MKSPQITILVIEDDPAVRRLLRTLLEDQGYRVLEASSVRDALDKLSKNDIALITLDLGLGRDNGLDLVQTIRAKTQIPIIIVSGKGDDVDKIVGLEIGADDYIAKPFNAREVIARIRAVLRRAPARLSSADAFQSSTVVKFGEWICDQAAHRLTDPNGRAVALTAREFNLLNVFLKRPQRVLSRQQLLDYLDIDNDETLERAIDTLVGRLRRKLSVSDDALIQTMRGAGYMLTVKVVAVDGPPAVSSPVPSRGA